MDVEKLREVLAQYQTQSKQRESEYWMCQGAIQAVTVLLQKIEEEKDEGLTGHDADG